MPDIVTLPDRQPDGKDGSTVLGTGTLTIINGTPLALLTTSSLAMGARSITATNGGDAGDLASSSAPINVTVGKDTTKTIAAPSLAEAFAGQQVVLYVVVSALAPGAGAPTGPVVFKDGSTTVNTSYLVTTNGQTSTFVVTTSLTPGLHTITATYQGDAADLPSSSPSFTVDIVSSSTGSAELGAEPALAVATSPQASVPPQAAPAVQVAPTPSPVRTALITPEQDQSWVAALEALDDERYP